MIDKTTSLENAIGYIKDGQIVGLGGLTIYRRPVAFVVALINSPDPPRNLTLFSFTGGLASDLLVGAGLVNKTRTCYFGFEIFGLAPMFSSAANAGTLEIIEESEASIAAGLRAKMAGIGFMPSTAWQGTEMQSIRPDVKSIVDPYTGHELSAFPAISCDVAIIHVLKADRFGNCILGGNPTIDSELADIADVTIITAEQVLEKLPGPIDISGHAVTCVVHRQRGAWPTSCYPLYPIDGEEFLRYIDACNQGNFSGFIQSFPL